MQLSKCINIGKKLEEQLNHVGIMNYDELKEVGSQEAWLRIRQNDPST